MVDLKSTLQECLDREQAEAVRDVTKKTLQIRVAKKVLKHSGVSREELQFVLDPDTVFVHPQVSDYLSRNVPFENEPVLQKFYSSDYHRPADVDAFCDWMDANALDKNARFHANVAFAVDGFRGDGLGRYKDHLQFALRETREAPDWEEENRRGEKHAETHARAVRHLYENNGPMKPEVVRICIQSVLDKPEPTSRIGKSYKDSLGTLFDRVKEHLNEYVCFDPPNGNE